MKMPFYWAYQLLCILMLVALIAQSWTIYERHVQNEKYRQLNEQYEQTIVRLDVIAQEAEKRIQANGGTGA